MAQQQRKQKHSTVSVLNALAIVEKDDVEALRAIVAKGEVELDARIENGHLSGWSLVDVALVLDHRRCSSFLMDAGAMPSPELCGTNELLNKIETLQKRTLREAQCSKNSGLTTKEECRQLKRLEKQLLQLRKMKSVVKNCALPGPLSEATAFASASDTITVEWKKPRLQIDGDMHICVKVEWSLSDSFNHVEGEIVVRDIRNNKAQIRGLRRGLRYSIRVSAGTMRGFGSPCVATPRLILLSGWEDVQDCLKMHNGMDEISALFQDVERHRQSTLWQTVFPKFHDSNMKKKRTRLKDLFSAGSKFVRSCARGVHLTSIIYSDEKLLCTLDDLLPVLTIDENATHISKEDLYWAMKLSLCWDQVQCIQECAATSSSNAHFRSSFIEAVIQMQNALGIKDIGRVHYETISCSEEGTTFIVTVRFVDNCQSVQGVTVQWNGLSKMVCKRTTCTAMDTLSNELLNVLNFFESSQIPLRKGLYLCYLKLHSTINTIRVVVPRNAPSILPYVFIRDNGHVSKEEWEWLRLVDISASSKPLPGQLHFHNAIVAAASLLLHDLHIEDNLMHLQRLYRLQVFELNFGVSFILLLPKTEDVCSAPSCSWNVVEESDHKRGCLSLPMPIFEMIHLYTYNLNFITTYCHLSIFIEHFLVVVQYEQRNCLLETEARTFEQLLVTLNEFQRRLENVWKSARWMSSIASSARDKQSKCALPLATLHNAVLPSVYGGRSEHQGSLDANEAEIRRAHFYSGSYTEDSCATEVSMGVIRIYAAYQCGFSKGTSVRLQIASTTTSREVVTLVVEQLAKAAAAANEHAEEAEAHEYCLTAVVGSRERRLRDDFPPLKLQHPWSKGRLFIRRRDCVLAAIQRGNEATV
ncbi:Ankyrin repeat and fibronectin type-III domain-containing protein 1 [Toxocara canis]|uniref:Ankyrin repeat and fibronectin type-III domain-containing protein 1 n=1 Tax=Toxocara canis TaxID=6265 RepID=A0A0B2VN29_TOXCA|nr:Ankyrin repeat and fibronectin type-III domain-containing protein 1 [Toxocara canis]